jgi:hypothetical protein
MSNKFVGAAKFFSNLIKGGAQKDKGKAIKKVQVGTELTKKRKSQDDFVDFRSKLHTSAGFDTATKNKLKMKNPLYKSNKKTSDIFTPKEPKFSKGGRVGLRFGTKKKSNVQKIKETFGPKQNPQSRMTGKKKKFPDLTGDGKVTFADILKGRGVKRG